MKMKVFNKIVDFIAGNMALLIILSSLFCIFKPEVVLPAAQIKFGSISITNAFLMIIMFGMGTTLKVDDFKLILKRPLDVFTGVAGKFIVMPLAGFVLAKIFKLDGALAVGLILLGSVPGGTASNVLTFIAKGDVPLSVTITACTTLLATIATPGLTYLYTREWVQVDFMAMALSIVEVVIVPIILGVVVHKIVGDKILKVKRYIVCCSVLAVVGVVSSCVAVNAENILQPSAGIIAVCVLIQNVIGFAAGYVIAKALKMDVHKTNSLILELGMQNSGLGVGLAGQFANPLTALPCAVATIVHQISGSILASILAKNADKNENIAVKTVNA